jgi:hypothetical protein
MRRKLVFFLGTAVVAGVIGLGWPGLFRSSRAPTARAADPDPAPKTAPFDHGFDRARERDLKWMGAATCSAASCHHENDVPGQPRSEFSTWAGSDPHARAYRVLLTERSDTIARNYTRRDDAKAINEPICLKCHASFDAPDLDAHKQQTGERYFIGDGVSCESCHGRAEKYLTTHYQSGFKELSLDDKAKQYGLRPTKDLAHRARLCAECHVGETLGKEVNHDLMAGGHPRIVFEMSGYHHIYPRHWRRDDELKRHPDLDARLWVIGQIGTGRCAVDLLRQRAEGAEKSKAPWPEFAEYDCYACHRNIKVDSPTQLGRLGGKITRPAGSL